jgi:prepilin signal peptidase PulO-like enzyme (type II secretory pathway)
MNTLLPASVYVAFFGVLGAIMGSFLNVVALRYRVHTMMGRSKCSNCSSSLRWYELIPIVSYIIQLGRCRHCASRISPRYLLVESVMALAFSVQALVTHNAAVLLLGLVAMCLCLVMSLYDIRSQYLPSELLYALIVVGVVLYAVSIYFGVFIFDIFSVLMLCVPTALLMLLNVVSGGRWIGLGDGILIAGLSLVLGDAMLVWYALILSCWLGAVYGVASMVYQKSHHKRVSHMIPFGPFLIVGHFVIWWLYLGGYI